MVSGVGAILRSLPRCGVGVFRCGAVLAVHRHADGRGQRHGVVLFFRFGFGAWYGGLLRHVELTTDPENVASQRVIIANGGVLLGGFRKEAAYGGEEGLRFRINL